MNTGKSVSISREEMVLPVPGRFPKEGLGDPLWAHDLVRKVYSVILFVPRGGQRGDASFPDRADRRISDCGALIQRHGRILRGIHMKYSDCLIRSLRQEEAELLKDFLYEAIFIPEGAEPPPRDIVEKPELRVYTDGFGSRQGDNCLVSDIGGQVVGAVWTRIMNDYGHIDDETPSFAISLYGPYRGRGIGTRLMREMLALLKEQGYRQASLAVQKENHAVKMYENVGFRTVARNGEEYIMVCRLQ